MQERDMLSTQINSEKESKNSPILNLALNVIQAITDKQKKDGAHISRIAALALIKNRIMNISDEEIIENLELAVMVIKIGGHFGLFEEEGSSFLKTTKQFLVAAKEHIREEKYFDKDDAKAGDRAKEIKKNLIDSRFKALPRPLFTSIVKYSDRQSIIALSNTNKFFKKSIDDIETLWQYNVAMNYLNHPSLPSKKIILGLLKPSVSIEDKECNDTSWKTIHELCANNVQKQKHYNVSPVIQCVAQFPPTDDFKNYAEHLKNDKILIENEHILADFYNWINQHSRDTTNQDRYNKLDKARADARKTDGRDKHEVVRPTNFALYTLIEIAIHFAPIAVIIHLLEQYPKNSPFWMRENLLRTAAGIGRLSVCKLIFEYYYSSNTLGLGFSMDLSSKSRIIAVANGHFNVANYFYETLKNWYVTEKKTMLPLSQVLDENSLALLKHVYGRKEIIFNAKNIDFCFSDRDEVTTHSQIILLYLMNFHEVIPDEIVWLTMRRNLTPILEYFVSCRGVLLTKLNENSETLLISYFRTQELHIKLQTAKYLIDAGVDVAHQSTLGETALHLIDKFIKMRDSSSPTHPPYTTKSDLEQIKNHLEKKLAASHSKEDSTNAPCRHSLQS